MEEPLEPHHELPEVLAAYSWKPLSDLLDKLLQPALIPGFFLLTPPGLVIRLTALAVD
jgi:hypothetical protein